MAAASAERVAVLADAHIGGPGGPAQPLVEQLDALPGEGCARLVLLGDLFHIWVGSRKFETSDHRAVLDALERLKVAGVRLDYIEGNRDFFIADSPYAAVFQSVVFSLPFQVGAKRYLAVHGDGLDPSDRKYRFWAWLSKSWPSRVAWLNLPTPIAKFLAEGTERNLARTNPLHKARIPEEVLVEYAKRRLAEGHDELILGHFHEPREWQLGDGVLRLVDAWFRTREIEWLGGA